MTVAVESCQISHKTGGLHLPLWSMCLHLGLEVLKLWCWCGKIRFFPLGRCFSCSWGATALVVCAQRCRLIAAWSQRMGNMEPGYPWLSWSYFRQARFILCADFLGFGAKSTWIQSAEQISVSRKTLCQADHMKILDPKISVFSKVTSL